MENGNSESIKKQKIKELFKNKEKLIFISLFLAVIIIRLYYFALTKNQPIWWDEGDYLSAAKSYAGIGDYQLESIRLPALSILLSFFFKLGLSEPIIRFFMLLVPSLILIFLAYSVFIQMYSDKRIAYISTLIFAVLWEHVFYSNRFQTENFALIFEFLAIFVLFKSYLKKENIGPIKSRYSLLIIFLFAGLSVVFRPGNIIYLPGLIIFLILLKGKILFKNKKNTLLTSISSVILLVIFLIVINNLSLPIISSYYNPNQPISIISFTVFEGFFKPINPSLPNLMFYLFLFGIASLLFKTALRYDKFKNIDSNKEDLNFKADMLNLLLILSTLIAFVFFLRPSAFEYRWFFPLMPGLLVFTAKGAIELSEFIGNKTSNKSVAIILIILIALFGFYTQLVKTDVIVKSKINSYSQVRESGLWMRENSEPGDKIISASVTQHSYYSERKIYDFNINQSGSYYNETLFTKKVLEMRPKYVVVSAFEPTFTPQWAYEWAQKNQDLVIPVKAYQDDQGQPILVIYQVV